MAAVAPVATATALPPLPTPRSTALSPLPTPRSLAVSWFPLVPGPSLIAHAFWKSLWARIERPASPGRYSEATARFLRPRSATVIAWLSGAALEKCAVRRVPPSDTRSRVT
jgi:hypothetical protein